MTAATIPAVLRAAAQRWPADEALVDDGVRLSFSGLLREVEVTARAFVASGLQPGDRVALWAPNTARWVISALAVYAAGGVLVPLNTRFKGPEAAYVLAKSRARFLLTTTDFLGTDYVALLSGEPSAVEETIVLSGPDRPRTVQWASFLARGTGADDEDVRRREGELGPDSISDIVFTSGTTGRHKGAMLTHGASTRAYTSWSEVVGLRHGDRYLIVYPFFHCAGLKSGILACLLTGAVIVPHQVFDTPSVMKRVAEERITMLPGPPAIYQTMLNSDLQSYDFSSLRLAVTGAAVVPVELVVQMREQLRLASIVTGYGLTESTGILTMCRHDDDPEVISRTCGRPIPGVDIRLVDTDGRPVPVGEPGEVLARGYVLMHGYFDDDAATAEAIDGDGWLHTGDVGVLDEGGNLRITDRMKDMFIVGGFNAYPAEIEAVLLEHPSVAQVAVVGVPDDRLGEVGAAFVVPRIGEQVDIGQLLAWCKERMANYKVPRSVVVVDELPLNASGKVLKYELRARASQRA